MGFQPIDRVAPAADVVCRVLGDEAVIVSLDGGVYYGLDAVGTRMWQLFDTRDLGGVAQAICEEFDVSPDRALADVLAFADTLASKRLITRVVDA
jgi:hypothetical protein